MSEISTNKEFIVREFIESIDNTTKNDIDKLYMAIDMAQKDWIIAQQYFDFAYDYDLIDFAIYNQLACEKKYTCLMKEAKKLKLIR